MYWKSILFCTVTLIIQGRNIVHFTQLHLQSLLQIQLVLLQLYQYHIQPLILLQLQFMSSKQAWPATGRVVLTGGA